MPKLPLDSQALEVADLEARKRPREGEHYEVDENGCWALPLDPSALEAAAKAAYYANPMRLENGTIQPWEEQFEMQHPEESFKMRQLRAAVTAYLEAAGFKTEVVGNPETGQSYGRYRVVGPWGDVQDQTP
jgi:hypothetical protein